MKKRRIRLWTAAVVLLLLILWIAWGNTALKLTVYKVPSDDLPEDFDGYRIAQISDLHNTEIGDHNRRLLTMLQDAQPDLIAITGDLIDSRRTDLDVALAFAEKAAEIAPCCYVPGNHESRIDSYDTLKAGLEAVGVMVLENRGITLDASGGTISLLGLRDPSFPMELQDDALQTNVLDALDSFWPEEKTYTVLLSHRPELFDTYVKQGADLVLSGHAHGGQFRLPLVGGLIAPNQGLFPKFDGGLYTEGSTSMVVSRGIGNSLFPFRFNNRPEVVLLVLEQAK